MMMRRFLMFVVFCLSILSAGNAFARPVTDAEKVALDQSLTRFEAEMRRGDMTAIIGEMPPRVFPYLAEKSGTSVEQIKAMVVKLSGSMLDMIGDFGFEHNAILFKELPDGTPYALIPTTTIVKLKDGRSYRAKSDTLAILEGGSWYLMRVDEPKQLMILHGAYPDFSGEKLPKGSMEPLED